MTKTSRVFVSCFLGGAIGTFFGITLSMINWWLATMIGVFLGAVVSGFVYALPEIRTHAPVVARIVWRGLVYLPKIVRCAGIILLAPYWFARWVYKLSIVGRSRMLAIFLFAFSFWIFARWMGYMIESKGPYTLSFMMLGMLILVSMECVCFFLCRPGLRKKERPSTKRLILALVVVSPLGPVALTAILIRWIASKFPVVVRATGEMFLFSGRFAKIIYIRVHSREMVLCCFDGGLGVAFALLVACLFDIALGPAIVIGGLAGGLFGVIDYEIISRRVLRLPT